MFICYVSSIWSIFLWHMCKTSLFDLAVTMNWNLLSRLSLVVLAYQQAITTTKLRQSTLVTIDEGKHTFPSRTRSLSPQSPMVVPPRCGVRVGYRQYYAPNPRKWVRSFLLRASNTAATGLWHVRQNPLFCADVACFFSVSSDNSAPTITFVNIQSVGRDPVESSVFI